MIFLHYLARVIIVFMIASGTILSIILVIIRLKEVRRLRAELKSRRKGLA
jgi:hypothetical protein